MRAWAGGRQPRGPAPRQGQQAACLYECPYAALPIACHTAAQSAEATQWPKRLCVGGGSRRGRQGGVGGEASCWAQPCSLPGLAPRSPGDSAQRRGAALQGGMAAPAHGRCKWEGMCGRRVARPQKWQWWILGAGTGKSLKLSKHFSPPHTRLLPTPPLPLAPHPNTGAEQGPGRAQCAHLGVEGSGGAWDPGLGMPLPLR